MTLLWAFSFSAVLLGRGLSALACESEISEGVAMFCSSHWGCAKQDAVRAIQKMDAFMFSRGCGGEQTYRGGCQRVLVSTH